MRFILLGFLAAAQGFLGHPVAPRPTSRPNPRPASPIDVDEATRTNELDWRSFRAKLEGAGLDATAREAWSEEGWAHALPAADAGGLLLALPFSATLCHAASPWYKDVRRFSSRKRWAAARALDVPASRLAPSDREGADRRHRRDARRFAGVELKRVTETPPHARTLRDRRFLDDREAALRRARDVVLVLSLNDAGGGTCLRLGRQDRGAPWGSRRRSAALFAALECDEGGVPDFHEFQAAFGSEVTVYTGSRTIEDWEGVAWQGEAILLHARAELDGASELGCGIYRGGAAAAARLVANGEADAAEFSFFVGLYDFGPGELREAVDAGLYQPAACASAQVLGGANAWHDLMRKLGGANADIEMLAPKLPMRNFDAVDGPKGDYDTFGAA